MSKMMKKYSKYAFVIFGLLITSKLTAQTNAVSVVDATASFPGSVQVDTYIIQTPTSFLGFSQNNYFVLQTPTTTPTPTQTIIGFNDFIKGALVNELGDGGDKMGVNQVEALKAQAVAQQSFLLNNIFSSPITLQSVPQSILTANNAAACSTSN